MSNPMDELYRRLNQAAEELNEERGRPVSMREALLRMIESMELKPSDFTWSSRIKDLEKSPRP